MAGGSAERSTTASVLFTDLAASTELRRDLGDDRADQLRRRHDEAIRAAAATEQGEVVKGTGDGLMVVFPAAAHAVAGAIAIQRAVHRLSRDLGVALPVRIGVSAGDVAWDGDDCFGTAVVEAARLCAAADGAQILVSEVVRLLAGSRGGHEFVTAGALDLKGLGPIVAHEVGWEPDRIEQPGLPLALSTAEATLPLVGRVEEHDALVMAWKKAIEGAPQVVLVGGEPGVGKTRLAGELARRAHEEGAIVLFGRCDEELGVPYQPFTEAIATYAAASHDDALDEIGSDLARLVPSLAARLQLAEPMRADPETERYRLFEAFLRFLVTTSERAPVLFVIDDLHWAARPTLLLLRHLVRHRGGERVLILATYRDTDLGRGHPLSEALADLRREADVGRVVLRGLAEDEVVELVSSAAGHELDAPTMRLARDVHAETEGNPFFVGQVLRHLVESGAVEDVDGRWKVSSRRWAGIPEGVREVIGKRLSQLSDDTNEVLSVAAVIGREFDGALLVQASGLDGERVLDALEEAEAARLVLTTRGHDDRRTFAHALVRSTLYEEIPTTRRLRMHRRVAGALAERSARGVPCLDQLAHHSCEAAALGDVESALRWSRAAAQESYARLAYEEAATWYERALDVLDPDDPAQCASRAELRVALARALRAGGALPASRSMALAGVDEARTAGRSDLLAEAAMVIAGDRGWSDAGRVDEELIRLLEETLQVLPPGDAPLRAMAMARLASELYFMPSEGDRRQDLTSQALAMIDRVDDLNATTFVLGCALWGSWVPGNAAERRLRALEIIELSERSENLADQLMGNMWITGCEAELGDGEGFRAAVERERALATDLRQPEWLWASAVHQGMVALCDGRFDDAEACMAESLRIGTPLESENVLQMYGIQHMSVARARGDLEGLLPLLEAMVEQFPLLPAWGCGLAYLYRDLGRLDEARQIFDRLAERDFLDLPPDANWTVGMGLLAAVCATLGDTERAEVLYGLLLPLADMTVTAGMPAECFGSVHGPLVLLAAAMDRWDVAEGHYLASQTADERMGARSSLVHSRFEWGRLLARRGDPRAEAVLSSCRAAAAELGMTRIVELCASDLASAGFVL
jgi:class 3 adenylate cyclase/tetratricopeptide (TPR) repeat protein